MHDVIWSDLLEEMEANPNKSEPYAFVLGGQLCAGKSALIEIAQERLCGDVLVINGDEFRKYHPQYKMLQAMYGQDAAKHTAEFAAKMVNEMLDKAIQERMNIVIEGTFRTSETPIQTLKKLKENGYKTSVLIQTCDKNVSWKSCLERYEKLGSFNPNIARYTPKEHHDLVVEMLPKNAEIVYKSGLADEFVVFARLEINKDEFINHEIYNSKNGKEFEAKMMSQISIKELTLIKKRKLIAPNTKAKTKI